MSALMSLAGLDNTHLLDAGIVDLISNDDELAAAIAAMEKEKRADSIKSAAALIMELNRDANNCIVGLAEELRAIRSRERNLMANIKTVNLARNYARATRNYLPLLIAIGIDPRAIPAELRTAGKHEVPDGWTPDAKPVIEKQAVKKPAVKKPVAKK